MNYPRRGPALSSGKPMQARLPSSSASLRHGCHRTLFYSHRSLAVARAAASPVMQRTPWPDELDDAFSGLDNGSGYFTVAGFGSLLSERSARSTFPDLQGFRPGKVLGWRRVFAHTADIFFKRGLARPETSEIASLSCEPCPGQEVVVSLFEVPYSPETVKAFIEREVEFRFVAVRALTLDGRPDTSDRAVMCAIHTDTEYFAKRCPPEEFERRWAVHNVDKVWRDDVLPCRVYLRHCVLAAKSFCPEAEANFLDSTYLSDRTTPMRAYLQENPEIMLELPPPELIGRYSG